MQCTTQGDSLAAGVKQGCWSSPSDIQQGTNWNARAPKPWRRPPWKHANMFGWRGASRDRGAALGGKRHIRHADKISPPQELIRRNGQGV